MNNQNLTNKAYFKFKKSIFTLSALLLLCLLVTSCGQTNVAEPISRSNLKLGTIVTVNLYDTTDTSIIDKLYSRLDEIENKMSLNITTSELNEINNSAGIKPVIVSKETFNIIKNSIEFSKLSEGNFDISIGPIVKLWGIGTDNAKVPTKNDIELLLPLVNYEDIILNEDNVSVFLKNSYMVIDLGAIAKGYAADQLVEILNESGVNKAMINIGGNIYAKGKKSETDFWKIGVQNPFDARGSYMGIVEVKDQTVVTSGIYERFIESEGNKYHHILSPFDGYPVNNDLASVTIVTSKSIDADAYSTVLFALGLKKGLELVNTKEDIYAIFVTHDKKIYLSNGLENIFELSNSSFEIKSIN